jgi:zinc transport system permease protein
MRLLGSLLISSLIIFPTLSAMRLCRTFKGIVFTSVIISIIAFVAGLMASYIFATPTGATVVIANLIIFVIAYLIEKIRKC